MAAPSLTRLKQIQINTYTRSDQGDPNLDANPATGGFQVVWESAGQDGDGLGVFAQNFSARGQKVGGEIQVNTVTVGDQMNADVAFNAEGNGSWVWQTDAIWRVDSTEFDAVPINDDVADNYRTRSKTFGFESDEIDIYNEERVRYGRTFDEEDNNAINPRVIALGDDHFATSMQRLQRGSDVVVDEYIPASSARGNNREGAWSRNFTEDELQPRAHTTSNDLAQLDAETILVVNTMTADPATGALGVIQFQPFYRRLDDDEQGLGFELGDRVVLEGSGQTGPARAPRIAVLEDGGFAITWSELNAEAPVPHFDVWFQVFDRDLGARTEATLAHREDDGVQADSAIAALPDGGFVITYTDVDGRDGDGDGAGIVGQRFDADGLRLGEAVVINSAAAGDQNNSNLTVLKSGFVVATWQSSQGDGDGAGVFAQGLQVERYDDSKAQFVAGTAGNDRFDTGGGDDVVEGGGGRDFIRGGTGDDSVFGEAGNDTVVGDAGNDTLFGGAGNDTLAGLQGRDAFVYDGGRDLVYDFEDGRDILAIDGSVHESGRLNAALLEAASDASSGTLVFDFGGGNTLTLRGVGDFDVVEDQLFFF